MKKMILNGLLISMAACLMVMPVSASTQENVTEADAGMDPKETGSDDVEERIYQVALPIHGTQST